MISGMANERPRDDVLDTLRRALVVLDALDAAEADILPTRTAELRSSLREELYAVAVALGAGRTVS